MANPIESVFGGKYEILKEIGRGGMSTVYLAMDRHLNKQWAIKEIKKSGTSQKGVIYVQSLITEANMMKKLDHPAIPRIVDITDNEAAIYIVMDYVEGESLDKVLLKFGPQPQEMVLDWVKQLADALNYLHTQTPPIIYRDMKPANVMLKPDGTVKLIDFGTAREYKGTNRADTVILGTQGYAAPEQHGKRETDGRTDIYCLGMTMHTLLTGQNPSAPDYEYFPVRHWNPEIHEGIERVIEKCVRPDPEDRFQNCTELLYALENYEQDTVAYKNAQKKKVRLFVVAAALSLTMFLASLGSFVVAQAVKKGDYEAHINVSAAASLDTRVDEYAEAVRLDPKRLEAYDKLLDAYQDNGKFDREESGVLSGLFGKYSGAKNTKEYAELCYRMGFMYFNFYTEDGHTSFQARAVKSAGYFEQVHALLEAQPDIDFDKAEAAESYYTITSFYKANNGMQLAKAHTAEELSQLLNAFSTCMDALENYDESRDESAQAVKLDQYMHIAEQINELRNEFAAAGTDKADVLALLEKISASESKIQLASLSAQREKALADCLAFCDNVSRAYQD